MNNGTNNLKNSESICSSSVLLSAQQCMWQEMTIGFNITLQVLGISGYLVYDHITFQMAFHSACNDSLIIGPLLLCFKRQGFLLPATLHTKKLNLFIYLFVMQDLSQKRLYSFPWHLMLQTEELLLCWKLARFLNWNILCIINFT